MLQNSQRSLRRNILRRTSVIADLAALHGHRNFGMHIAHEGKRNSRHQASTKTACTPGGTGNLAGLQQTVQNAGVRIHSCTLQATEYQIQKKTPRNVTTTARQASAT
jgi:hypothetical protein